MAVSYAVAKRGRYNFGKIKEILDMPDLIEIQRRSYKWFLEEGSQRPSETSRRFRFHGKLGLNSLILPLASQIRCGRMQGSDVT